MPAVESSPLQPEQFATSAQTDTLYNLARSLRNMNGAPDFNVRYKCMLTDVPPEGVFAEASEPRPDVRLCKQTGGAAAAVPPLSGYRHALAASHRVVGA